LTSYVTARALGKSATSELQGKTVTAVDRIEKISRGDVQNVCDNWSAS
jgi:hypothetical protein